MDIDTLVRFLDRPGDAAPWLRGLGLEDPQRAHANLLGMARSGMTLDLLANIAAQLGERLPAISDPDMALNNLERLVAAARNPLSWGSLFERDAAALPVLLQIFSHSQYLSEVLIRHPDAFDIVRMTDGQPVARELLLREIKSEIESLTDERAVMAALRRYKHRETLRIAYGDFIRGHHIRVTAEQISYLADALLEAAVAAALRSLIEKRGAPIRPDGGRARFAVLALGKLGGVELNYSSDIDLIFLCDDGGATDALRPIENSEFFARLARDVVRLLSEPTELGSAYRVDLRLRPQGSQGIAVTPLAVALDYYERIGRTWERQAFVKARCVAGDLDLGREFLDRLESWVYRRYLSRADITGIKALKRRIEQRARREGADERNVKTGHGGLRDIEFVIQFLQLLNGGDLPEIRTGNTLEAIGRLEAAGCLTLQERHLLEENYAFLRKIEHRLQIMFDLQTHELPKDPGELRKVAIRLGYQGTPHRSALQAFQADYQQKTELNHKVLDHLLHEAFAEDDRPEREVDLVLDPNPSAGMIDEVLGQYGFRDVPSAYANLAALATEPIPFLSTRRCRHFLASIAPKLLRAVGETPDPDFTLTTLSQVADSLGGKGVLWELFSVHPASLSLCVQVCAASPYLASILTSHPGMIDELMDSLMLDRLPTSEFLRTTLLDLCRGAEDIEPILHGFKNSQHLSVGVRDILGKEDVKNTHRALSDIAQSCLEVVAGQEYVRLIEKYGEPLIAEGPRAGEPCELIILAMGKLGGREPNYHSDLDVIFLYEADGQTQHRLPTRKIDTTTNQHFFSQLGQRIIKVITQLGPHGRLYELDARLRPTGRSGPLAVSLAELARYFASGEGQLWERQALCKARPVYGTERARQETLDVVRQAITARPWQGSDAAEIRHMRARLEETASPRNIKRGRGGTVDVEFAVQMLQLRCAAERPDVLTPGTLDAIAALHGAGALDAADAAELARSYRFLRSIETGLRLMNTTARHDLPSDERELRRLAYLLGRGGPEAIVADCERCTAGNRALFERLFAAAEHAPV